jgi:hypothetical protein
MRYNIIGTKKHFNSLVIACVLLLALAACKRDLGNYNYNPVNVITITTDTVNANRLMVINNDSLVVQQGDTLKVKVLLSQTKASDDLSFSWMITQRTSSAGNPGQYVIGNAQQLAARILQSPGLYNLVLKTTDNKTGVSYYKAYTLNVGTSPWGNEGWLVLQDETTGSGGCDLSVITTRDGVTRGTIYNNVYSLANGHLLPTGTSKINVMSYAYPSVGSQKVSFFYPGGGLQVRSTDFTDSSSFDSWFSVAPSPGLQVNVMVSGGSYEQLINNGILYFRQITQATVKTPPVLFGPPILGTWKLAPFVLSGSLAGDYTITLYDATYKSFLVYNESLGQLATNANDVPNKHMATYPVTQAAQDSLKGIASGFDMNNIGRDLLYAENVTFLGTSGSSYYNCFFRNSFDDSTWLYQMPISNTAPTNGNTTGRFYLDPSRVPGINVATKFAVPTHVTTKDKFYYLFNNTIYPALCNPMQTLRRHLLTSLSLQARLSR